MWLFNFYEVCLQRDGGVLDWQFISGCVVTITHSRTTRNSLLELVTVANTYSNSLSDTKLYGLHETISNVTSYISCEMFLFGPWCQCFVTWTRDGQCLHPSHNRKKSTRDASSDLWRQSPEKRRPSRHLNTSLGRDDCDDEGPTCDCDWTHPSLSVPFVQKLDSVPFWLGRPEAPETDGRGLETKVATRPNVHTRYMRVGAEGHSPVESRSHGLSLSMKGSSRSSLTDIVDRCQRNVLQTQRVHWTYSDNIRIAPNTV